MKNEGQKKSGFLALILLIKAFLHASYFILHTFVYTVDLAGIDSLTAMSVYPSLLMKGSKAKRRARLIAWVKSRCC